MAADGELELDHDRRRPQGGVDVAVALADDRHLGVAAGGELARLGLGGEQHRQLGDLHGHQIGSVLGNVGILGEHRRHRIADIAHLAGRQHRLAVRFERRDAALAEIDRRNVGDVGRAPDRDHARERARGRGVERDDRAMGVVRAHDAHVQLVRKRNVAGKAAAAAHQGRIFQPLDRLPDPPVAAHGCCYLRCCCM